MKYRKLRLDELKKLEQQFILFLSAQSIPADDWEKIKREDVPRSNELIEQFSDVVFEKSLVNVQYLEKFAPNTLQAFRCLEDKMLLKMVIVEGEEDLDFTKAENVLETLQELMNKKANIKIYKGAKPYEKDREIELFEMVETGAYIGEPGKSLFEALNFEE